MAISDLLPRKAMKSKTMPQTLSDRLDYDQKPEKTNSGELVSTYMCSPESAAEEFLISKQLYEATTGRSQPVDRDIIMYRIIQSFKPGEIDPETANRIGYELAMRFTKGKHQFVFFEELRSSEDVQQALKAALDELAKESSYLFEQEQVKEPYSPGAGTADLKPDNKPVSLQDALQERIYGKKGI